MSSRNIDLTEALRAAAEEKVGRLSRFLDGMDRAQVHLVEERNPRITDRVMCEVTMEGHGFHVRAKVNAADATAALDAVVPKLEQQLHKLKTKVVSRNHPRRPLPVPAGLDEPLDDASEPGADTEPAREVEDDAVDPNRIVRSKRFEMKPMTPEEAVLQMDLLGHDFYFFSNADTGRAGVVYRRRSGDIGLIDEAG